MIFVALRRGDDGIGTVGSNLTRAIGEISEVEQLLPDRLYQSPLPGPLLERFYRPKPIVTATKNVAYVVFENNLEVEASELRQRCRFDFLAATSRWCEASLRSAGIESVTTIHHGVDSTRFNPDFAARRRRRDRFVVFSGGKFEFRKAQDVVVRAFRAFSERHDDAFLVAAWFNPWLRHAATMCRSPYLPFSMSADDTLEHAIRQWLVRSEIDLRKVELLPNVSNAEIAVIYGDSDVGLFPSRCEGATNLMMMEYMACGRAVLATDFSGHTDLLSASNSVPLRSFRPLPIKHNGKNVAVWCEPDVDEIVEGLERVYCDRERLLELGREAAKDLHEWNWSRAARSFAGLLMP